MFFLKSHTSIPVFIKAAIITATLLLCVVNFAVFAESGQATAKRVEVYSLSQNYWDTQYGDSLSKISIHLLPNNPSKRDALERDIVRLNPDAFINGNPELLLANKRLWMPGYMKQADSKANPNTTIVESYDWGNIKRSR